MDQAYISGCIIRSRTRIFISWLIPACFKLFVYIFQIVADSAVSYQHFVSHQTNFGWLTFTLIVVPSILNFAFVLSSREQWRNPKYGSRLHFASCQLMNLVFFPFFAIARFACRIFWTIEAFFHDDDDEERMLCLLKAGECSTGEMYDVIRAYGQAAPQILLQLNHILTQNSFRNYETTFVQTLSLLFSTIHLSAVSVTYQRFASQKVLGRPYPWSSPSQIEQQNRRAEALAQFQKNCEHKKLESRRNIAYFPETEKVFENFKQCRESSEESEIQSAEPQDGISTSPLQCEFRDVAPMTPPPPLPFPAAHSLEWDPYPERNSCPKIHGSTWNFRKRGIYALVLDQLVMLKKMLVVNAQLFVKQKVPHAPKIFTQLVDESDHFPSSYNPEKDADDFLKSTTVDNVVIIKGIEEDDFPGKSVAFVGWVSFILIRMLSLAIFYIFFPRILQIVLLIHYQVMLFFLILESKSQTKANRLVFYLLLAYVYIFVILEFRIKFNRVRLWYTGYFLITVTENIAMTILWHSHPDAESWWFELIYVSVGFSAILVLMSLLIYYYVLRPKQIYFILNSDESKI